MLGFLNINKPTGMTSNFVVQKIKKKFHIKKIGHLGTLDPMASGVLPIAVGKATRLFDFSLNKSKKYIATFDFGYTTDTLDITGTVTIDSGKIPTRQEVVGVLDSLCGDVDQIPPNFSAKNINGERAYKLARKGIEFELKPKSVTIQTIKLLEQLGNNRFKFEIECSSGTYIRSIARDMAEALGTIGCMSALERVQTGYFDIESSISFNDLLEKESLEGVIISPQKAFPGLESITVDEKIFKDLLDGKKVAYPKLNKETFVVFNDKVLGIARPNIETLQLNVFLYDEEET